MERVILTADDGMVLTDGTIYGRVIYLAVGDDPSVFYQITEAEYIAAKEREKEQDDPEALADDELEV